MLSRRIAALLLLLLGLQLGCGRATAVPAAFSGGAARPLAEFDVGNGAMPLCVPVTYGARDLTFVVDTGCAITVLDDSFKPFLRQIQAKARGMTPLGPVDIVLYEYPDNLRLRHLAFRGVGPVTCMDLAPIAKTFGRDIDGILGMGFLGQFVVQLDLRNQVLRLFQPSAPPRVNWDTMEKLKTSMDGRPMVNGSVMGLRRWFLIDTGMLSTGMLDTDTFSKLAQDGQVTVATIEAADIKGVAENRVGRFPNVCVSDLVASDVILLEGNSSALGLGYLSRRLVTLDFPRKRIFFGAEDDLSACRDEIGMSGLGLIRIDGKTVADSVDKDSPAEQAGIEARDVLMDVDGKAAAEMEMWEIRRLLKSADGKLITMTIKRGEKTFEVSFRLKRRL